MGDFLKELDLTEAEATGIPRIKKALKENGSSEPFFDFDEDRTFFKVDFYIHPAFKKDGKLIETTKNPFLENLAERSLQIIEQINNNANITASEISVSLGISKRAIEKPLSKLKSTGLIERLGSDKTGHWIIKSSV